jgi:hypothetical protein
MNIKRIVSTLLSVTLIYGVLTIIIAGGFALSMGFAMAASPILSNSGLVRNDSPPVRSPEHAPVTAVVASETSTPGK